MTTLVENRMSDINQVILIDFFSGLLTQKFDIENLT
jgi:hypothetical protein